MNIPRATLTLLLTTMLAFVAGYFRPQKSTAGLPSDLFWARKASLNPGYDLVVCGDSRVLVGVSPAAMEGVLKGCRIVNFTFNSQGYSASYPASAERLLDKRDKPLVVLLGITPYSLTEDAERNNMFEAMKQLHPAETYQRVRWMKFLDFFRPYNWQAVKWLFADENKGLRQYYHEDGWVASYLDPPDPDRLLNLFRKNFKGNKVRTDIIGELVKKVGHWRSKGIFVVGFRPPTSAEMEKIEAEEGGFDQEFFVREFKAGGGIWIDVHGSQYDCYDGSHITERTAIQLSKILAGDIQRAILKGR
jgi:hypothetical protein